MVKGIEAILIGSKNPKALADFYHHKVGLKQTMEMEIGEDGEQGFAFEMEGTSLYINHHSEVPEHSQDPKRILMNLEVDNIEEEVKRLGESGVKPIQDIYHVEGYGLIATFEDVDGNYFQFVQVKPTED